MSGGGGRIREKEKVKNPASRNSNSHVTNIGITSPLGKAKRICVPVREATATVYGALRVLEVPSIFYHKRQEKSI